MTKPRRSALAPMCALLALAVPATATAGDPLLSGYSGPGGGEQVVLGSKLLPPRGGGGGGGGGASGGSALRAAPVATPTHETAATPSTPSGSTPSTAAPAPRPAARRHPARRERSQAPASPAPDTARGAPNRAAPTVIPYPSRASSAGGLPLTQSDIVLIALVASALILVALALRRLAPGQEAPR